MTAATGARDTARRAVFRSYAAERRREWIEATGASMGGAVGPGARLLVEFGALPERVGEVVVVDDARAVVAHRLVAIRGHGPGRRYATKGDAVPYPDPSITADRILGVVRAVRTADGVERPAGVRPIDGLRARAGWVTGRIRWRLRRARRPRTTS